MKYIAAVFTLTFFLFISCQLTRAKLHESIPAPASAEKLVNQEGHTLSARFNTPGGFQRVPAKENSFAAYLRNLPLKPHGAKVQYFDGRYKNKIVYDAVVDIEIGDRDLQQCADAVMRLRAEYFFQRKQFEKISFRLTNGFKADYTSWMQGNRLAVEGNTTWWKKTKPASNTYKDFRAYMEMVFAYAGTLSLSKQLQSKPVNEMAIGDVFILGGSPGHAVIVVDMAENPNGEKIFLLAQSYMPAQETQILKNPKDKTISPWYRASFDDDLQTPEWTFSADQLKTW